MKMEIVAGRGHEYPCVAYESFDVLLTQHVRRAVLVEANYFGLGHGALLGVAINSGSRVDRRKRR